MPSHLDRPLAQRVLGVIPARYASTRFPAKPLAIIAGKPMIQWVYEAGSKAKTLTDLVVATDDARIFDVVKGFDGKAIMTSVDHLSGSDRLAEVALAMPSDIIVNLQGDEPLLPPELIDQAVQALLDDPDLLASTAVTRFRDFEELHSPDTAKVLLSKGQDALYFSRSVVPYSREQKPDLKNYWKHIGLYVYRASFLPRFAQLKSHLEGIESLEQLRLLENGVRMRVVKTNYQPVGVDRPEDIATVEERLKA
jgi:3-deoxy-manno-octulosonate cytidylyltransferase (CMP-KDO synthetase)